MQSLSAPALGLCFLLSACAHKSIFPPAAEVVPPENSSPEASLAIAKGAPSDNPAIEDDADEKKIDDQAADQIAIDQPAPTPSADEEGWVTSKLADVKKISVLLPFADVRLQTGASKKHASIRVRIWPQNAQKPGKNEKCNAEIDAIDGGWRVVESKNLGKKIAGTLSGALRFIARSMPASFDRKYEVEIDAAEPTEMFVKLLRGSVTAERWKKNVSVEMDWGDIDVGMVGPLTVNCGRCTVAGEDVSGAFNFKIANGNVGMIGLEGPVSGETLGDLLLKWKKLPTDSKVKLHSRAGDVVLGLPKGVPVALQLKTPRGDSSIGELTSTEKGVPLDVTAEIGNIRVYRH